MFIEIMASIGVITIGFIIYNALDNYSKYRLMNSDWDSKKGKWIYNKKK